MPSQVNSTSFAHQRFGQTLNSHRYILKAYKTGIDDAIKLTGDLPIFLDTSVILSVYEISFIAREKIKQFLLSQKQRIVLTQQVQFEFIKNREKVINAFQSDVTEQIPNNFKSEVLNKIIAFNNNNKAKLEDYDRLQEQLKNLQTEIEALHDNIAQTVNDKRGTANSILLEDDFLDILSATTLLESLTQKHLDIIKGDYNGLLPSYKNSNADSFNINSFPGCAEKGDKDDPTGDYIIFHEMMEYALTKKSDIIFLTNDSSKGDWMRKDGKAHFHYIENFFLNTEQIIYILNAERIFEELFNTSFESLISEETLPKISKFDEASLESFLNLYQPFDVRSKLKTGHIDSELLDELKINNINSLQELETILNATQSVIKPILAKYPQFNRIGLLRGCLKIYDMNYLQMNKEGNYDNDNSDLLAIHSRWIYKNLYSKKDG